MQEEQLGSSCNMSCIHSLELVDLRIRSLGDIFSPGSPFAALKELVLNNNNITSMAALGGLQNLTSLRISNNRLGDAEPDCLSFEAPRRSPSQNDPAAERGLHGALLPSLQLLDIAGNGLTSLLPLKLQHLPLLRSLLVQNNELQQLDGLSGLQQLQEVLADKNKVR
jgi:Leucine-rich repeat (LRR) protein